MTRRIILLLICLSLTCSTVSCKILLKRKYRKLKERVGVEAVVPGIPDSTTRNK